MATFGLHNLSHPGRGVLYLHYLDAVFGLIGIGNVHNLARYLNYKLLRKYILSLLASTGGWLSGIENILLNGIYCSIVILVTIKLMVSGS